MHDDTASPVEEASNGKVHVLKLADKNPHNTVMLEQFDEECKRLREILADNPHSGYVILCYRRENIDSVTTDGGYYFADVMDKFWLPDFAKLKIRSLIG